MTIELYVLAAGLSVNFTECRHCDHGTGIVYDIDFAEFTLVPAAAPCGMLAWHGWPPDSYLASLDEVDARACLHLKLQLPDVAQVRIAP